MENEYKNAGILLSPSEADEYCTFKREKRIQEAEASLERSETDGRKTLYADLKKACETAKKLSSASIKITPDCLPQVKGLLTGTGVHIDCVVGGNGSTSTKVKVAETKYALRLGAKEITLILSPYDLKNNRLSDVKKQIAKVKKAAKKSTVKVSLTADTTEELLRLTKAATTAGAKYVGIPFYTGIEKLKAEIGDGCMLEVTGVETASDYKTLVLAGVERISTDHGESISEELMKEAEEYLPPFVAKD